MKLKTTRMYLDPARLRGRFERLRNDVEYKDVTITSNDIIVSAHKCVLSVSCEFFKVLFQQADMNKQHFNRSTFDIGGFTSEEAKFLEPVIDFLYSGTVYMNDINFTGLVKVAEYLMVEELIELCERYVTMTASKENYLKLYLDLKKNLLSADTSKESKIISNRTSGLLKLLWEMVEMNFYDHIIDNHEFLEVLPLEVENLIHENFKLDKVLKLACRWMKTWPLGYTFADSLINISHDKLVDVIEAELNEDITTSIVKTTLMVKDQVKNRTVPKSNKANMLIKLDRILEQFGDSLDEKKTENVAEDKGEVIVENMDKSVVAMEDGIDKMTDNATDIDKEVIEGNGDAQMSVVQASVPQTFDIVNIGYVDTDGVLDLSAKDSSRYLSVPKVDSAKNYAQVADNRTESEKEKNVDAVLDITNSAHEIELTPCVAVDTEKSNSIDAVPMKVDDPEIGKEAAKDSILSDMQENVLDEVKGSNIETTTCDEMNSNKVPNFEEDQEIGIKMDGTTDLDGETDKNEMELTDEMEDSVGGLKDNDGNVTIGEGDESAVETIEEADDGIAYTRFKQNSGMADEDIDDDVISVKSEDHIEDENITRLIHDRVSECLNLQEKVNHELSNSKVAPLKCKITRRKGVHRLVDDDPDYEVPSKRSRRKKSAAQASKKNSKRRIEIIHDSATESGVETAVVKVEVDNKSLDENIFPTEKGMDAKDSDIEDVFSEFMQTQGDNDDAVDEENVRTNRNRKRSNGPSKGRHHECEICHKVYTQKYRLRQHMNMHLGIKPHKCVVCSQMFSRTDHVIRHMRSQHCNMDVFECDICNEKFEKPNEIVSHYLNHNPADIDTDRQKTVFTEDEKLIITVTTLESGKTQYDCKLCEKSFKKPYQAREHVNSHTGEKPYKCDQCDSAYAKKDNLSTHIRMVHDGVKGEFQCSKCKRYFFKKENYEAHEEKCAPNYKCDKCPMLFYRKTHLDNHTPTHDSTPQIQCQHCDSKFKYRKHLSRHIKKDHSEMKPDTSECICDQCGVILKSKEALYRHKKVHKVPDKECDVCGKAFKDNTTLKDHKLMHSNIRDYQCEICSMLFSRKGNLVRHQKRHRGERKYRCEVCGMCFVANCDLTRHKNTHLGVKKFPCRYCGRKFGLRSKVTVHERTHTGERPYFCREENCGKTFKQTGDRVRHEKKVHNLVFNKYMTLYELATGETEDIYKRAQFEKNDGDTGGMKAPMMELPSGTNTVEGNSTLNPVAMDTNTVYCPPLDITATTSTAEIIVPTGNTAATTVSVFNAPLSNPAATNVVLKNDAHDAIETALQLATSSAIHAVSNLTPTDLRLAAQSGTAMEESNVEDIEMSRMFQRTVAQFGSQMM